MTWLPSVEWSISLGTMVHLVGLLIGLVTAYIKIRERLTAIETKLDPVWRWWVEMTHPPHKSDEELDHEIRGLQQVLALRKEMKARP